MITTKIRIKDHLAEYLNSKYYNDKAKCVCIPDELDLYHTVWNLLETRPVNCVPDEGNVEIALPKRRIGKDPVTYNYLGVRSIRIIEKRTEVLLFAELFVKMDDSKINEGIEYQDTAYEFLNRYKIISISPDALLKSFYRYRELIRKRKKKRAYNKS